MPLFFSQASLFRDWLLANSRTHTELLVGFYTVRSGWPSMTWPQSVDEALCVGWIDAVRRNLDPQSYQIRFTPRKNSSHWSNVNIKRVDVLTREGRMLPTGLAAFALRTEGRSRQAAYEQPGMPTLPPEAEARFQTHPQAWSYFNAQAASYRKRLIWRITSAKQEATRERRLQALIEASSAGKRLDA